MHHYPQTVIRPITEHDLPELINLAEKAGITNLPKDKNALEQKIATSIHSFKNGGNDLEILGYMFVLEQIKSKEIIGCSGIAAAGSYMVPFYHFKLSTVNYVCQELNLSSHHKILTMVNDYQGCSEICSLFLLPEHRKNYNGSLLSRSRFLFMAERMERFSEVIIAEMRGVMYEDGSQPFWDHVISKFIDIPFLEADKLTGIGKKQFISDLMPRYPIYTDYLPKAAQDVIDCVHKSTEPALAILKREGFRSQGYVDIFDTGPMVECELSRIHTVAQSRLAIVSNLVADSSKFDDNLYLVSNTRIDIRVTIARLMIENDNDTLQVSMTQETAEILNINKNDQIRFINLKYV